MSSGPHIPFAGRIHLLDPFKHGRDGHAFNPKGLEDKGCHSVHYPIVTVRCVHGCDGSQGARLTGDIVKQPFLQDPHWRLCDSVC
jgi:hypothetical protein